MPVRQVMTTLLQCDFCPAAIAHAAGTGAPSAGEYVAQAGWTILGDPGEPQTVACPACKPILDTITGELDVRLTRALLGTG